MSSMASLVSLGSVCGCSSGQFEGSFSLVGRVSFSKKFGSVNRIWVGKRWRYVSVCRYSVTTDFIADQGTSISLDSSSSNNKEEDADLLLKPAPKPQLKPGPKPGPVLGNGPVLSSDSDGGKRNPIEEERSKVIETLGEALDKVEQLETNRKTNVSVNKSSANAQNTQRNSKLVDSDDSSNRKSKTLKSVWKKGNPVAAVKKVVKPPPKQEPMTAGGRNNESQTVAPLKPPQPPQKVQPQLLSRPSVAPPPPPVIKKPVILKDVGAAAKSSPSDRIESAIES